MAGRACEPQQKHTAPGHKEGTDWAYKKKIHSYSNYLLLQILFFNLTKKCHFSFEKEYICTAVNTN